MTMTTITFLAFAFALILASALRLLITVIARNAGISFLKGFNKAVPGPPTKALQLTRPGGCQIVETLQQQRTFRQYQLS
jgi:hypothetical protein